MANPSSGVQPSAENNNQNKNDADSETDDDDDDEVIETSPCGRWEKHKKEVSFAILLPFLALFGRLPLLENNRND